MATLAPHTATQGAPLTQSVTLPFPAVSHPGSFEMTNLPHSAVELVDRRGAVVSWEHFFDLGEADLVQAEAAAAAAGGARRRAY